MEKPLCFVLVLISIIHYLDGASPAEKALDWAKGLWEDIESPFIGSDNNDDSSSNDAEERHPFVSMFPERREMPDIDQPERPAEERHPFPERRALSDEPFSPSWHKRRPFVSMFPEKKELFGGKGGVGDPLILTPYIEQKKIHLAYEKARVAGLSDHVHSFSGFFTVNKKFNSNLFFWFVPSKFGPLQSPTILWLQGGPGGSSLFGLFVEHGPFSVDEHLELHNRSTAWSLPYNMIYVDQPAGTGFSFTDEGGYANDEEQVAEEMYEFMRQFYTMFPSMLKNELYVAGESYAGKYVPAISYKIHEKNAAGSLPKMPLAGLAIGDGLCDPVHQLNYGEFLYQVGLADESTRDECRNLSLIIKNKIAEKDFEGASEIMDMAFDYVMNTTGLEFYYNFLISKEPKDFNYYADFLNQPHIRKYIHVGNLPYDGVSMKVHQHLHADMTRTVSKSIEKLLNNDYKVMIYNGQLDIIIAYPQTENFILNLDWHGSDAYKTAPRLIWRVNGDVAGYAREVGKFRQVMVRNAGHILPYDQPKWAFDMIQRFIKGKSFG